MAIRTKCSAVGRFVVIGFQELGEGRLEALYVMEDRGGALVHRVIRERW